MYKQALYLTVVVLLSHISFSIDFLLVNGCFVCLCLESVLFPRFPEAGYLNIVQPLVLIRWEQTLCLRVVVAIATSTFCAFLCRHRLLKLKRNYFFLIKILVVLISRLVRSVQISVAFLEYLIVLLGPYLFDRSSIYCKMVAGEKLRWISELRNLAGDNFCESRRNEHWRIAMNSFFLRR